MSNLLFILFWIVSIVVGVLLIITKKKQYLVAYIIASAILYVTKTKVYDDTSFPVETTNFSYDNSGVR